MTDHRDHGDENDNLREGFWIFKNDDVGLGGTMRWVEMPDQNTPATSPLPLRGSEIEKEGGSEG